MEAIFPAYRRKPLMTRMTVVIALLLFIPFCQVFGALSEPGRVHSYLNCLSLALALLAFPAIAARINLRIVLLCSFGMAVYAVNFALGPFASPKWFLNTLGLLFVFMVVSNYMKTVNPQQLILLERHFSRLILTLWSVCACFYGVTLCQYWADIVAFTTTMRFNNSVYILARNYGIQKQLLGLLFAAIGLWHVVYWGSLGRMWKVLFVLFMGFSIPFFIGIRTLLLSLGLLWVFVLWSSKKITFPTKLATFVLMPLAITFILVCSGFDIAGSLRQRYNRLPCLLFAVETLRQYPQGLGNGGYTPFVLAQANSLFREYGVQAYGLRRFPPAPESDLVYFIGSFGVLSPLFFCFCGYVLMKCRRIMHVCGVSRLERFVLLFAMVLIFAGISQDFAGKLAWWTYLGAATGLIFRYCPSTHVAWGALQVLRKHDRHVAIGSA